MFNERGLRAWGMLALGIILVIVGARGRFGSFLGALITPNAMIDQQQAQQDVSQAVKNTIPTFQGATLP